MIQMLSLRDGIVEDDNFEKLIEKRGEFYSLYKKNNIKEN